jgi:phosphatidylglycerophosphate synthase
MQQADRDRGSDSEVVPPGSEARRPVKTRARGWARRLGAKLAALGVTPNAISLASVVFSALAAGAFIAIPFSSGSAARVALLAAAALCIQGRLLANMLDGLVAVESGKHTPTGELFNEIPDRVDDLLILTGAGLAVGTLWGGVLGVTCAVLALLTAYLRLLAGSLGLPQHFSGPMAKPQRMAALTFFCLAGAVEVMVTGTPQWALGLGLGVIAAGTLVTAISRVRRTAEDARAR